MRKLIKFELNTGWMIIQEKEGIKINALVPGSVYEDLINHNIIEDPFYGLNEVKMDWVYESDWIYYLKFDLPNNYENILDYPNIILRFNGIDTISTIYFNNVLLGTTENMFRTYEFNIKSYIKKENNEIKVKINSPTKYARDEISKYHVKLNTGPCAIPGVPYIRKAQFSFGWDWGPKLPDIGIWKPVEIIALDGIKIEDIFTTQNFFYSELREIKKVNLNVSIYLNIEKNLIDLNKYEIKAILECPNDEILTSKVDINKEIVNTNFEIENPKLWWPHNLGNPNLYNLKVLVVKKGEEDSIDFRSIKIGLRDVELIQEKDKWGKTFYFKINNIPIFAKGANWVPIDSFIPRGRRNKLYEFLLKDVKDSNMNMVRVWGGGIYEDDIFYDICDQMGILVWQEFPFACALYPINEEFFDNVKKEAIENIKRIRNHPSHIIWCGNNEIEQFWLIYSRNIIKNRKKYKEKYIELFEELLPKLVAEYDPKKLYWPSSPSNGTIKKGGFLKSNNPNMGDSHYWMVWHGGRSFKAYRKFNSRFMSEFGFESFPDMKTIFEFCSPELKDEFRFDSPIMKNHQKNMAGNQKILNYMKKRFNIPMNFENQIILSQITQAEAMEYGVEHWRRNRNNFHCMGSLYWQLNDCWPVASWSSIDYYGRWKALHYFARRFYSNIFPSIEEFKDKFNIWITNDSLCEFKGKLEWKLYNIDSDIAAVILNGIEEINVPKNSSLKIKEIQIPKNIKSRYKISSLIIFYKLYGTENIIYSGFKLFDDPKNMRLLDPEISFETKIENNEIILSIFSKRIALYIHINSNKFDFIASDNFFSMEPNEIRNITIKPAISWNKKIIGYKEESINYEEFVKNLKISSLYDLMK